MLTYFLRLSDLQGVCPSMGERHSRISHGAKSHRWGSFHIIKIMKEFLAERVGQLMKQMIVSRQPSGGYRE
ncbi:hypothetical protein TNIN_306661 [Trichonephila inaurata madagascariensis]|uniref:Uncharacterized protein n=1 Tax=Trichonephila inaurata madagascariensis TaxID=2747483 RepID=A0A8X7CGK1_9ARAC|nr:hypothetical protein TNIN_306661 [Trichonephila inaurata madagascariensis]